MKTSNHPTAEAVEPRLVCRVVQRWSAMTGDVAAPRASSWMARHAGVCACCRTYFSRAKGWENSLRRTAAGQRATPSTGFEESIMAAVRQSAKPTVPRSLKAGWWLTLGAGVAATALIALVISRPASAPPDGVPSMQLNGSASSANERMTNPEQNARWEALRPGANALLAAAPLESEIEALYADARSALGFLALNFLPESTADAPLAQPQRGASG